MNLLSRSVGSRTQQSQWGRDLALTTTSCLPRSFIPKDDKRAGAGPKPPIQALTYPSGIPVSTQPTSFPHESLKSALAEPLTIWTHSRLISCVIPGDLYSRKTVPEGNGVVRGRWALETLPQLCLPPWPGSLQWCSVPTYGRRSVPHQPPECLCHMGYPYLANL